MDTKITCYIIDDEPLAVEVLESYVKKVPFLDLKGSFKSAVDASAKIKQDKPALLFLDVNMPDIDGISFISMLNPRPTIVLTTAYDQFALKAYDLEVADYLLKPIPFERFYRGVLRIYESFQQSGPSPSTETTKSSYEDKRYVFVKVGHKIQKVALDEILFIEGMKDYVRIHTLKEKIMTLNTFSKIEDLIQNDNIVRVHKSYMVAIDKIQNIEKGRITIGDHVVPIGDMYADAFYRKIKT